MTTHPSRRLQTGAGLAALALGCTLASPSPAKGPRVAPVEGSPPVTAPAPVLQVGPDEQAIARRLEISAGRSLVVELPRDAKEVFVANPKVANAVVRSTRKLFVIGMENGATSIFVMDGEGRQIAALEVNVGRDLTVLRQTLRTALPRAQIDVKPAGDSILMTGVVDSAADAQQAADIARAFVGQSGGGAGSAGPGGVSLSMGSPTVGGVINSLTIRGRDQVMVRVTVVEVSRSVLKQLGVSTQGSWSGFDFATQSVLPISAQNFASTQTLSASASRGASSIGATLQAFERAGVSRVLAEPTLVAISGESATFTAGGEIPVPQSQSCDPVVVTRCTISVTYKPYGVNLAFTPVVLSAGRISLRVNTEVTELDYENAVNITNINVPAVRARRSATTVELPSGATMMTAGLLSQASNSAITGTPGLLNLPILGALFRSRDYQRRETEMMIMVTPYIAQPMAAGQAARPDDGFQEASDGQTALLGRLNRLYGVAGAPPQRQQIKGRFGFITD